MTLSSAVHQLQETGLYNIRAPSEYRQATASCGHSHATFMNQYNYNAITNTTHLLEGTVSLPLVVAASILCNPQVRRSVGQSANSEHSLLISIILSMYMTMYQLKLITDVIKSILYNGQQTLSSFNHRGGRFLIRREVGLLSLLRMLSLLGI